MRRDTLGRAIGRNWWRELNVGILADQERIWQDGLEAYAVGYATEAAEYAERHPRPTLKQLLIDNAGMSRQEV